MPVHKTGTLLVSLALFGGACSKTPNPLDMPDLSMQPPSSDMRGSEQGDMAAKPGLNGMALAVRITEGGDKPSPENLTQPDKTLAALAADGNFSVLPITKADGSFSFPDLKTDSVWLRQGSDRYFYLKGRSTLNLNRYLLGRGDAVMYQPMAMSPELTLNFSNFAPWGDNHDIQLVIPNLNFVDSPLSYVEFIPAAGSTSFKGVVLLWGDLATPYLIDPQKGDKNYLVQMATQTVSGVEYSSIVRSGTADGLTTTDPMGAYTVNATFADTAPTAAASIKWLRSQFDAQRTATHPSATPTIQSAVVVANPGGEGRADIGDAPELLRFYPSPGATDLDLGTVSYKNPYPSTWIPYGRFVQSYRTLISYGGLPNTSSFTAEISVADTMAALSQGPIQPRITPPLDLRVNGNPATVQRSGIGLTPTISFSPPALGTPSGYLITINSVTKENTMMYPRITRVAMIYTKERELTLPKGIVEMGKGYLIRVRAILQDGDLLDAPYKTPVRRSYADALSALLTPENPS